MLYLKIFLSQACATWPLSVDPLGERRLELIMHWFIELGVAANDVIPQTESKVR